MSLGTFFKDVEAEAERLFKIAPKGLAFATTTLKVATPIIDLITEDVGGSTAEAEVTPVLNQIKSDLAGASLLIQQGGTSPSLAGLLTDVTTNLGTILQILQVKDTATATKVTSGVNDAVAIVESIIAAL